MTERVGAQNNRQVYAFCRQLCGFGRMFALPEAMINPLGVGFRQSFFHNGISARECIADHG